ncbi:zinc-binding alcohol dehydrogenase [Fervidibacter sacchari]|uniref:2-desacetyl-2-hydroxyethyl bacteriochlorophyllide A dehydrogenase n=1 Tax=Candidatus Fervidibacter sacchari TaxID=1448929 RepID=A0ABT2ET84_9BACT|nr:zinc-binding alcohol dehydrogenase [Candidatus Fervidibacter sacchari]MCS3921183.1 2-desacetyl-2-hydroxyethyl bacteriochlorophyllide A dehydrogenase [Candidatus Fervidibacter sacchari]WKU16430.1 zinc-binding alcohol dehydrogenase [Candidatus Fervidibacter sacchari]
MKSYRVVWTEPKVVKVEEWEVPEVVGRQVLVKTRFTLISPGTERAWLLHLPNTPATFPQYPGYCAVGEVLEVGEEVKQFKKGDRVVWAGRHAAHAVVNEDALLPVPSDLPDEGAVFFRLIAIALQGVRKARIELGESVVVLGAGLIGLLALQLAKLSGGFPVIAVDLSEVRLKFAQEVEADFTLQLSEDLNACVSELTDGGAHVVIEATGNPEAIPLAFKLARRIGRVILLGSTRGETKSVNFYTDVHRKGLVIVGAHDSVRPQFDSTPSFWTARDDQALALKLLAVHRIKVAPLITHKFSGMEAPKAYDLLISNDMSALGILLDWSDTSSKQGC